MRLSLILLRTLAILAVVHFSNGRKNTLQKRISSMNQAMNRQAQLRADQVKTTDETVKTRLEFGIKREGQQAETHESKMFMAFQYLRNILQQIKSESIPDVQELEEALMREKNVAKAATDEAIEKAKAGDVNAAMNFQDLTMVYDKYAKAAMNLAEYLQEAPTNRAPGSKQTSSCINLISLPIL